MLREHVAFIPATAPATAPAPKKKKPKAAKKVKAASKAAAAKVKAAPGAAISTPKKATPAGEVPETPDATPSDAEKATLAGEVPETPDATPSDADRFPGLNSATKTFRGVRCPSNPEKRLKFLAAKAKHDTEMANKKAAKQKPHEKAKEESDDEKAKEESDADDDQPAKKKARRGLNIFHLFVKETMASVRSPDMTPQQAMKELAKLWPSRKDAFKAEVAGRHEGDAAGTSPAAAAAKDDDAAGTRRKINGKQPLQTN